MNAKSLAEWVRKQREKKKLTLKEFHKAFNEFLHLRGSSAKRSYQWVTGLEKYGEFAKKELEIINSLVRFFGYRIVLLPKDKIDELDEQEKREADSLVAEEQKSEKKHSEQQTQKNIIDKNW